MEEVGVSESRLKWTGHGDRMEGNCDGSRSDTIWGLPLDRRLTFSVFYRRACLLLHMVDGFQPLSTGIRNYLA